MRIAILSDIHLAPPRTNRCQIEPQRLNEHLLALLADYDEVVVNGDIFDLSRTAIPTAWRSHLRTIERTYPELVETLGQTRWIYGNHDVDLRLRGTPASITYRGEIDLYLHHGHLFDRGLKRFPFVERGANFAAGWFARVGVSALNTGLERVSDTSERLAAGETPDIEGARRILRGGWDVVIQGHAHVQRLEVFDEGVYLNTGSQLGDAIEWGWVDTETREVALVRDDETVDLVRSDAQAIRTTRR